MKGKKFLMAVIGIAAIIGILFTNTITLVNSDNAATQLSKAYITVGDMSGGLNKKSYYDPSVNYSEFSAIEVLKAATKYLGARYGASDVYATDGETTYDFRCGELVSYAIYDAGYMDDITGLYKNDTFGESASLYDPLYNWGCYPNAEMAHTYAELGYEAYNQSTGTSYMQYDSTTTYNPAYSVTQMFAGKIGDKPINVLKVNEEVTTDYPYYKYTLNDSGDTAELPAGCVIYQFGCKFQKGSDTDYHDHLFLTLGNLGTSDATQAAEELVRRGILTEEQKNTCLTNGTISSKGNSNYWRIENNGSEGCVINNGEATTENITNGKRKGCDAVWAFQLFGEEVKEGSFNIKLVKYEKNTTIPLADASFSVTIDGLNYSASATTDANGVATFTKVENLHEGTFSVNVAETSAPDGYIGIPGPIKFDIEVYLDGNTYKLREKTETVENSKIVNVRPGEIEIQAENRTTSIDIHKGVKTVENQDSGYYASDKVMEYVLDGQAEGDASTEPTYEDETTGKEYSEVDLEDLQHEWVVETTIPEGIENYLRYKITDPVDTKLDFSGLDRVKVELIDSTGKVTKALVKDKDYQAKYENDVLTITYIDKKDGNNFYGGFLSEATTSNKIRLTFNTTFKVNPETGKLVVLEGTITNADNKAKLTYDNGSGEDKEKDSENPEVHTGAVSIFKYEDTNGNKKHDEGEKALVGAEFKIALSEDDAKNGKFIKVDGRELVAISNEHGLATFTGLEFGGDAEGQVKQTTHSVTGAPVYEYDWETASRDYYIVETKTPAGYEKVTDVLKVTVSKNSSEIIDLTDKINEMESVGNRPLKFDLALRKWVTHAFVTENGKTVEYKTGHKAEDNPEAVVKVDLKKSNLNKVTVKFKYSIRITNEGEIAGEAREITDYIPTGLKFVKEDNPDWTTTNDERIVKTRKLEGVTLQPGESAEVEIMLTWVNNKDSMGVMVNTAEISEDYNEYGIHDIDSTPNNKKAGEDDIDDAPVMLAIKTGSEVIGYASIGFGFVAIVAAGVAMIKRNFANI